MYLKRLRDLDGKKIVWTEGPSGKKCQVWTDESGNLYIYNNAQWLTYNGAEPAGQEYDKSSWVNLTDQVVGFYDKEDATELYSWDHGDDAYYQFVDWDGTVLKSGTVIEGGTPTAPANPTREATAQYTYTFAGWTPAVGPITKRTTYTATYTETLRQYTVTISSNDTSWGTVDESSLTLDYGTAISVSDNTVTFGTGESAVVVTATAISPATFTNWTAGGEQLPATVTSDLAVLATFYSTIKTLYSGTNGTIIHDTVAEEITYTYTGETTADLTTGDSMTIADKNIGATSCDPLEVDNCQGYCYQWGNNYGFPNTGALQTSATQVDASSYTASTYSSDTFITGRSGWDSSNNADLWGGTTGTDIARKGPCSNGYHIPSTIELKKLVNLITTITGETGKNMNPYLLTPTLYSLEKETGERATDIPTILFRGGIWGCEIGEEWPSTDGESLVINNLATAVAGNRRNTGLQIRPFKNVSI